MLVLLDQSFCLFSMIGIRFKSNLIFFYEEISIKNKELRNNEFFSVKITLFVYKK